MRTATPLLALLCLCGLALPAAHAEEDDDEMEAELAIGLPGALGLTGFMDMIDARTPELLSIRAGARYQVLVRDRDIGEAVEVSRQDERHDLVLYGGASALGFIDAAARIPYVYRESENNVLGVVDTVADRYENGWGDLDLAAKITIEFGLIDVAPYLFGRFPTAEPEVEDLAEFEYGVAATFSLLNEYLGFHANLAGLQREKGLSALRYRLGVSFVPWVDQDVLVRVYAYGDGIEYEGSASSDFDLDFGVQAILFRILTVELGMTVRLHDADYIDDELEQDLDLGGIVDQHFDDDGTWGIYLGVGVLF